MKKQREHGAEQPYIPLGIFKFRLPFVHYKFSGPEALQAIFLCATCLAAVPVLTDVLGLSFEIAWGMVILNGILYFLHATLGDPVVPGWITPGLPLVIAFLVPYEMGHERVQALVAVQLCVALIFLIMGITGAAKKIIIRIPGSIQAGILLGAGIVAIYTEFTPTGRFFQFPVSVGVAGLLAFFLLFGNSFKSLRARSPFFDKIGSVGMLPAIIVGIIIGPLAGEIPLPQIEIGTFVFFPPMREIMTSVSPLVIGFPTISMFIAAVPLAMILYIIAFGDLIASDALIEEAGRTRDDEKIDLNANRSNLICSARNAIMALFAPYPQHAGPMWTAVTAAVAQRYKEGRKAMDSIYGGVGTFRMMTAFYIMLFPIASLVKPVLPIALSLTMLVTGFICLNIAMSLCKTEKDRSIAGVMGCVLAVQGAIWGLAVGIILYFFLDCDFFKKSKNK